MDAVESKPRRLVTRGTRKRVAEKVKLSAVLDRRTVAKLSALAKWQGKDPCDLIEEALAVHLAGVRVTLPGDSDGQDTPPAQTLPPGSLPVGQKAST